ncbi:hypothetical protein PV08_08437 [Exophiala spinifera]|uniref:BZIP domain-containing protein n=1 Tax=Exophiala spinifera TaxID=91928 RepID=A0A0D2B3K8_9EURO|nr:uncharacterized protein PV08_08437 [Exophiala spinifera]KIW13250.1 hypothetical protein PV08_08437 [Exophiala spinifera]
MPTTDPARRRRQNCENQKRWRQRQLDKIQLLQDELEHTRARVRELEGESYDLRILLRNSEMKSEAQQAAHATQAAASLNPTPPSIGTETGMDRSQDLDSNPFGSIFPAPGLANLPAGSSSSDGTYESTATPAEKGWESLPDSNNLASKPRQRFPNAIDATSEPSEEDWASIVITGSEEGTRVSPPLSSEQAGFTSSSKNIPPYNQWFDPSYWVDGIPSDDVVETISTPSDKTKAVGMTEQAVLRAAGLSLMQIPTLPVRDRSPNCLPWAYEDKQFQDEQSTGYGEARGPVSYTNDIYFNWPMYSIIGGASAIWRNMVNFPDTTHISQHILAFQKVLHDAFRHLLVKPPDFREKVVAEAFSWLIESAWPSSESCFKMMTVYRHIFSFELFRIFPCQATLERIHPLYRPTELQCLVPHSPAIDWLPWPDIRERCIKMQDKINVDQLCQASLEHTIVEPAATYAVRSSNSNQSRLAGGSTFRIWDMYLLEKAGRGRFSISKSSMTYDPASRDLLALVHQHSLPIQNIEHLRIASPFYDRYPDFKIGRCESKYPTVPLHVPREERLGYPSKFKPESLSSLQSRVNALLAE